MYQFVQGMLRPPEKELSVCPGNAETARVGMYQFGQGMLRPLG